MSFPTPNSFPEGQGEPLGAVENSGLQLPVFRSIFGEQWDAFDGIFAAGTVLPAMPAQSTMCHDYSEILGKLTSNLDTSVDGFQVKQEPSCIGAYTPEFWSSKESLYSHSSDMTLSSSISTDCMQNLTKGSTYPLPELLSSPTLSTISSHQSLNSAYSSMSDLTVVVPNFNDSKTFLRYPSINQDSCEPSFVDGRELAKFKCPFEGCDKEFTRKANRRAHIATHDPNRQRPFECPRCPKTYLRSVDLARHVEISHDHNRKYKCEKCTRCFTRKEGLKKHQEKDTCRRKTE